MHTTRIDRVEGTIWVGVHQHEVALDTQVINANDLETGDYVLLPEAIDLGDVPSLVDPNEPMPELWRVAEWTGESGDTATVVFDAPGDDALDLVVGPDDEVRLVMPDQDHPTWDEP